ncbi:nucleoside phosphorylase [Zunongwangia sp. F363]|uniref:Uridine phosphorylase n=1 Tax=Autumnicola tepida TaxID=3075595 RepID=A0ABU3C680_9FLAO|nr:nucleoside phosphorylase [Zunongwangia sp. F363]MDT0641846.1 nucleoside phosphorylase [Zunongwangia sp. F363]
MSLAASEFILNIDGSIYHLNLLPENIAETIIVVGDPDRVDKVTAHFDSVDFKVRKREFHTQTGIYKGKRISVISTGIGTDNIDIVFNELDALVNIDFDSRSLKDKLTSLDIVRIGTTGSIQKDIPVDSFLLSEKGVGFDSLLHFYDSKHVQETELSRALMEHLQWPSQKSEPYAVNCDEELAKKLSSDKVFKGITGTNVGFYGPQGRILRLPLQDPALNNKLESFSWNGQKITNLEMETSGIYGLSKMLGHRAVSMNAVIANRASGTFSKDPKKVVEELISYCLEKLVAQ